jgi:tetratricopeptide (TPR) repeat protein
MKIIRQVYLSPLLVFAITFQAFSQKTNGALEVGKYESKTTLGQLFGELNHASADTNRVDILIKMSSIYQRKSTDQNQDSCIFFAKEALSLSTGLGYQWGVNESIFLECKALTRKNDLLSAKSLLSKVYGEEKVRLLLVLGEHYVFAPGGEKDNLNAAYPIIMHAVKLSDSIRTKSWRYQSLVLLSKYNFIRGDFDEGKAAILQIIGECKKNGDLATEAHYWSELGLYMPVGDSTFKEKLQCHQQAFNLYMLANMKKDAAYTLRDMASLNGDNNRPLLAEAQMAQMLKMLKDIQIRPSFNTYIIAARIYIVNGKYKESLSNVLTAVNDLKSDELALKMKAYSLLADIYAGLGNYREAVNYEKLVLNWCISTDNEYKFNHFQLLISMQISLGRPMDAFHLISNFAKTNIPIIVADKMEMALAFGNVYEALKEYKKAEMYYKQMVSMDKQLVAQRKKQLNYDGLERYYCFYTVANFYVGRKRFQEARPYILKALGAEIDHVSTVVKADIHRLSFKVDSATGDFKSALSHYQTQVALRDSMFNIEELGVKYQTGLNKQKIDFLQTAALYKDVQVKKLSFQRNVTLAGISMTLIMAGLVYSGYSRKRKSNLLLQNKQVEINNQNTAL